MVGEVAIEINIHVILYGRTLSLYNMDAAEIEAIRMFKVWIKGWNDISLTPPDP